MNTMELQNKLKLNLLTDLTDPKEITGGYVGDLLSRVMAGCKKGDVWITVQNSINVAAVALLNECACVIVCEGVEIAKNVTEKASEEGVIMFSSKMSAYELAKQISVLI